MPIPFLNFKGIAMDQWSAREGSPSPLGVTWIEEEQAFNFALYSRYATGVTLLIYSCKDVIHPAYTYKFDPLTNKSGRVWHCRLKASLIPACSYYAYTVSGPNEPGQGHRFDDQKILLDPYARSVFRPEHFSREAARRPGNNAGRAPLGMLVTDHAFDWSGDQRPEHTSDTVIYETHVKGFTMRPNSGVSPERRGTYAGLIEKIPYLVELGITAIELLPVFQQDTQEGSYWGYMPLSFFSPHREYAVNQSSEKAVSEFRSMVKAMHQAGIEVILDCVYNHSAEGGDNGPTYSYRGIDNDTYYLLQPDRVHYRDDSGTGNTLDCANPYVRKMIVDSIRFWSEDMHVDGFRFDLASLFTRKRDGSIDLEDPPVIAEISATSEAGRGRLIAEAWDLAAYELGKSFPGISWLQWNGKFRDDLRAFIKGDIDRVGDAMTRIYGSNHLFPDDVMNAYHSYQSVNFITSHDGFCLYDLVAYNQKHNHANGEGNRDGSDYNWSWNCGWEGDENVPASVVALRKQQIKNFCCLLLLSNGTPMFCAGDEFMNTQKGNNNPYNQDNETTWLDWDLLTKNQDIFRFFKNMIAFHKAHPSICRSRFWREDIRWYGVGEFTDLSPDSHSLAFCLQGAREQDTDLYVMINAYWQELTFKVQEGEAAEWYRVVDTGLPSPEDVLEPGNEAQLQTSNYTVQPRSTVVLIRK
jgi:glycogen operon protein